MFAVVCIGGDSICEVKNNEILWNITSEIFVLYLEVNEWIRLKILGIK